MIQRLRHLFRRYAARHLRMDMPTFPLLDEVNRQFGQVEAVRLENSRLRVTGWAEVEQVALISEVASASVEPTAPREDVAQSFDASDIPNVGFEIDIPFEAVMTTLCFRTKSARYSHFIPIPKIATLRWRKLLLLPGFLGRTLTAFPLMVAWQLTRRTDLRTRIKEKFGLSDGPIFVPVLPDSMAEPARPSADAKKPDTPITIIVPVYNAFELLPKMLDRVVKHTDLPWRMVMVEDCSTDAQVRPFVQEWAFGQNETQPGKVTLLENENNLGFVGSVNRAFEVAIGLGDHVVLLNTDAFVPSGWASRLVSPMTTNDRVATVTPMSNDAEIFSVPNICQRQDLSPGQIDEIDACAASLPSEVHFAQAPTGVGFCMAMNIKFLQKLPAFDMVFKRGYGEEVDWCQKARALGGIHVGHAGVFVEHRGGASFGGVEKMRLVAKNNAIVSGRYPGYDKDVQDFIQGDPLYSARLALAVAHVASASDGPCPIYLVHNLGGGAEFYIQNRLAHEFANGSPGAVVIRVGGFYRWQLEVHTSAGVTYGNAAEFDVVRGLLRPLSQRRIVYSCGVGDRAPLELPGLLLSLRQSDADVIEVLFHDFFPLSPSYTLLNEMGEFRGVPDAQDRDTAHQQKTVDGIQTLAEWREGWGALIGAADQLVVFSDDSAQHVASAYPNAAGTITVRPHDLITSVTPVVPPHGAPVLGVLGNIGFQKGVGVLQDLAKQLGASHDFGLVVIGNTDPEYPLSSPARIHGDYKVEDIPALIHRYGITHWLIPSIWPETFSFTTHEALATGLPVLCFDLGAQAEAVRAKPNGQVIPLAAGTDLAQAVRQEMQRSLEVA